MASLTTFIRNVPASSLQAYFHQPGIELPTEVDWQGPEPEVVRITLRAVDEMDDEARARIVNDAERVGALADDAGQTALYSVVDDRTVLDDLANGHARALWIFLNEPIRFRHAEEVRYTDERRRGRSWDGFIGEPNLDLRRDEPSLDAFKAALRERFASNNIHIDIFGRYRSTFDGEDCKLVQIAIYREGLLDDFLAFDDGGALVRRVRRPDFEAAMTYEPATGVIEVVANDRESREEIRISDRPTSPSVWPARSITRAGSSGWSTFAGTARASRSTCATSPSWLMPCRHLPAWDQSLDRRTKSPRSRRS